MKYLKHNFGDSWVEMIIAFQNKSAVFRFFQDGGGRRGGIIVHFTFKHLQTISDNIVQI